MAAPPERLEALVRDEVRGPVSELVGRVVVELPGDSKRVAADHYVYAVTDYREVDRSLALARATPAKAQLRCDR